MCHRTVEARSEPERLALALMGLCFSFLIMQTRVCSRRALRACLALKFEDLSSLAWSFYPVLRREGGNKPTILYFLSALSPGWQGTIFIGQR